MSKKYNSHFQCDECYCCEASDNMDGTVTCTGCGAVYGLKIVPKVVFERQTHGRYAHSGKVFA